MGDLVFFFVIVFVFGFRVFGLFTRPADRKEKGLKQFNN